MIQSIRTFALFLAALLSLAPVHAQTEQLKPAEAVSAAISKARPGVEALRPDAPIPTEALAGFTQKVQEGNLDEAAVRDGLSLLAKEHPGHNYVNATKRSCAAWTQDVCTGGWLVSYSSTGPNLRTNAGADWQAELMAKTTAPTVNTQCNYIALTNDAGAVAAGDTTLATEIAANGLTRAQGTYAHTASATSYTVSKTFTASGTQSFQKAGMFTASSSGTMCFETLVTSGTVNNTDTLTFTWTVNF